MSTAAGRRCCEQSRCSGRDCEPRHTTVLAQLDAESVRRSWMLVFYGLFGGFAIAALLTGVVAVVTGLHRRDHTVRLGLIAIGYVALAQTIQSLWD